MLKLKPIKFLFVFILILSVAACNKNYNMEKLKDEVYQVENSFEKMCADKGIAEAFYFFADDSAVIKRENDTLIIGKENIKSYYSNPAYKNALVNWTPDFIDVSVNGNMAYTYGKYLWKIWNDTGNTTEYRGVFHTVWKKQKDNSWKYVWD